MEVFNYNPLTMIYLNLKPSIGLVGFSEEWFKYDDRWISEIPKSTTPLSLINIVPATTKNSIITTASLKAFANKHQCSYYVQYGLPATLSSEIGNADFLAPLKTMFHLQTIYIFANHPLIPALKKIFGAQLTVVTPKLATPPLETIESVLKTGDLTKYHQLTNGYYNFHGSVVPRKQFARQLGYPTANLFFSEPLPIKPGVYLVQIKLPNDSTTYWGMSDYYLERNKNGWWFETHIFSYQNDIYGWNIEIQLVSYERENIHFSDLETLKHQLDLDYQKLTAKAATLQAATN